MKNDSIRLQQFRDPKARLNAALDTIEQYANQNFEGTLTHSLSFPQKNSRLSKMITLAKCFVGSTFSESFRKKLEEAQESQEKKLGHALEEIKRYHPVISNHSTSEAKTLTDRAMQTIQKFNQSIERSDEETSTWHNRLLKFLIKKNRKPLTMHKVELASSLQTKKNQLAQGEMHRVNNYILQRTLADPFTKREADAFRMKAISLVKNYEILFPSLKETLQFLRETPIMCALSETESNNVVSLQQTLSPFPGETIILKGSFMRDLKAGNASTPVPGSFEVITESVQTGFPYPSQHYGWALSDALLPTQVIHPEHLINVFPLLKKKEEVAESFLNKTLLLEKSRKIIEKKQQIARDNKETFLSLHKDLCLAILGSAKNDCLEYVEPFFSWVSKQESPLNTLCNVYREINRIYLDSQKSALLDAWLNLTELNLHLDNSKKRFEAAKKIASSTLKATEGPKSDKESVDFIQNFGSILGKGCLNLVLLGFAEIIDYAPPQLLAFEKKLHAAAFRQLRAFLKELRGELSFITFETIVQTIESDIELFNQKDVHDPLCSEVEKYYLNRYTKS